MIGRGALGNPWIFRQVSNCWPIQQPTFIRLSDGTCQTLPAPVRNGDHFRGEKVAHKEMIKFYRWYLRGFGHVAEIREN
jgi:tRNA-dihydrouridine synthase